MTKSSVRKVRIDVTVRMRGALFSSAQPGGILVMSKASAIVVDATGC